jgi:DNA-binding NarL/FixJ family response regulator
VRVSRLLLVDDHAVFREGLAKIFESERKWLVCAQAEDAATALSLARMHKPHAAVVDISLEGGINGLDLTKQLRARWPAMRILILSMHKEDIYAERALRAGANGYVMKHANGQQVMEALRQVIKGETYLSAAVREGMQQREISPVENLSNRELEVFQLIAKGYGTRQMAEALSVSMKTVETHREHIRGKLHLQTTFKLNQYALAWARSGHF